MNDKTEHWEAVYKTKDYKDVGWYQESPDISLKLLFKIGFNPEQSIIDVGCGASLLVDHLIEMKYRNITLVDLSSEALLTTKKRLEENADVPEYICQSVASPMANKTYDIWHDRAVFHFLTEEQDRQNYMDNLERCLAKDGKAIIGTFSNNGPKICSGLDIVQYDEAKMQAELGDEFEIEYTEINTHVVPGGNDKEYMYFIISHKS